MEGHLDIVTALLEKRADVHTKTRGGWTALEAADARGHADISSLLLQAGARPASAGAARAAEGGTRPDTKRSRTLDVLSPAMSGYPKEVRVGMDGAADISSRKEKLAVAPTYPRVALREGIPGRVTAQVWIDEEGTPSLVEIIFAQPARIFDEAVRKGMMASRYDPKGSPYVAEQTVQFDLK